MKIKKICWKKLIAITTYSPRCLGICHNFHLLGLQVIYQSLYRECRSVRQIWQLPRPADHCWWAAAPYLVLALQLPPLPPLPDVTVTSPVSIAWYSALRKVILSLILLVEKNWNSLSRPSLNEVKQVKLQQGGLPQKWKRGTKLIVITMFMVL